MLVVLAIVAILGAVLAVPRFDLDGRRREAAAETLELALAQALRRSRAGEPWRLAWQADAIELRRADAAEARRFPLPEGLRVQRLLADGLPWPAGQGLALAGFATPLLRLEMAAPGGLWVLRSLPTGRVERLAEAGA